jgi:hypothetical protein
VGIFPGSVIGALATIFGGSHVSRNDGEGVVMSGALAIISGDMSFTGGRYTMGPPGVLTSMTGGVNHGGRIPSLTPLLATNDGHGPSIAIGILGIPGAAAAVVAIAARMARMRAGREGIVG